MSIEGDNVTMAPDDPTNVTPWAQNPNAPPAPAPPTPPPSPGGGGAVQPSAAAMPPESFGSRVYHGILKALGGSQDTAITGYDPTSGKAIVSQRSLKPADQWKNIISGALTGLAADAGDKGPGSTMRKFGAGIQAGTAQREENAANQQKMAQQEFQNQQTAMTAQANRSLIGTTILMNQFKLEREQIKAQQDDIALANNFETLTRNAPEGTKDLGTFNNLQDAMAAVKKDHDLHTDHAEGRGYYIPNIVNGQVKGVRAAILTPDAMERMNDQPAQIKVPTGDTDDKGDPTFTTYDVPANSMKVGDLITHDMAYAANKGKQRLQDSQAAAAEERAKGQGNLNAARTAAAYAQAGAADARRDYLKSKTGANGLPAGPLPAFDANWPDPRYFPAGTAGIVPKQIGKVPAGVTTKAELAANVLDNTRAAMNVIRDHPEIFNTTQGWVERLTDWEGAKDPYLRDLATAIENTARASSGIHGMKGKYSMEEALNNLFKGVKENDTQGIVAALTRNAESSKSFLRDEKNFLYYGSRTGPDRKLARALPGDHISLTPAVSRTQTPPPTPPKVPPAGQKGTMQYSDGLHNVVTDGKGGYLDKGKVQ